MIVAHAASILMKSRQWEKWLTEDWSMWSGLLLPIGRQASPQVTCLGSVTCPAVCAKAALRTVWGHCQSDGLTHMCGCIADWCKGVRVGETAGAAVSAGWYAESQITLFKGQLSRLHLKFGFLWTTYTCELKIITLWKLKEDANNFFWEQFGFWCEFYLREFVFSCHWRMHANKIWAYEKSNWRILNRSNFIYDRASITS